MWHQQCAVGSLQSTPKGGYLRLPGGNATAFSSTHHCYMPPTSHTDSEPDAAVMLPATRDTPVPLTPDLGIPDEGRSYVGDVRVQSANPAAQEPQEED